MPTYRNARAFLDAAISRYRAIRSYSDRGVVRPLHSAEPVSCWFETDYAAPSRFRFEFIRPHPHRLLRTYRLTRYIAGSTGSATYFSTQERGGSLEIEAEENLEMAVAGATGISQGTAHTIGKLLLECVQGFSLTMLRRIRFRTSRAFDGVLCARVSGLHPRGGRYTAWFGEEDLLLRKLFRHYAKQEEVRFEIRIDLEIPDSRFDAPSGDET